MDLDTAHIRQNLMELHAKEVSILQERLSYLETERDKLSAKLMDEEQQVNELKVHLSSTNSRLSSEIVELKGTNRLRHFELERYQLSYEETLRMATKASEENDTLRRQLELVKKEYFELEVRLAQENAGDRAENVLLNSQLKSYLEMERELDSALKEVSGCVELGPGGSVMVVGGGGGVSTSAASLSGGGGGSAGSSGSYVAKESVTPADALLLGSTLAGAPSATRRRIQESLILGQQLSRKAQEVSTLKKELEASKEALKKATDDREALKIAAERALEPKHYLVETLREREAEILDLKRGEKIAEREYEALRVRHEELQGRAREMEKDLRSILTQRDGLEMLRAQAAALEGTKGPLPIASGKANLLRENRTIPASRG